MLQERGETLSAANNVVQNCGCLLLEKRETWGLEKVSNEIKKAENAYDLRDQASRSRNVPERFDDFVITDTIPQESGTDEDSLSRLS